MKNQNASREKSFKKSFIIILIMGLVTAAIFFAISSQKPELFDGENTVSVSGFFAEYSAEPKYSGRITLSDGMTYVLFSSHTPDGFDEKMSSLDIGTALSLTLEENGDHVIAVNADGEDILTADELRESCLRAQNLLSAEGRVLGCVVLGLVVFVGVLFLVDAKTKKRLDGEKAEKEARYGDGDTKPLRRADTEHKYRILLDAKADEYTVSEEHRNGENDLVLNGNVYENESYTIVYRRCKGVNELVVNGYVYDEIKAIVEPDHTLYAKIDGNTIEAGLETKSEGNSILHSVMFSFIRFNGDLIKSKVRQI